MIAVCTTCIIKAQPEPLYANLIPEHPFFPVTMSPSLGFHSVDKGSLTHATSFLRYYEPESFVPEWQQEPSVKSRDLGFFLL